MRVVRWPSRSPVVAKYALVALCLSITGCKNGAAQQAPPPPSLTAAGAETACIEPKVTTAAQSAPNRQTVEVDAGRMEISLSDGERIKAALVSRLEQSELGDKGDLLSSTRHISPTFDDGFLRIGIWILQPREGNLMLTYRGPFGRRAARLYTARVTKTADGWQVGEIVTGEVWLRQ